MSKTELEEGKKNFGKERLCKDISNGQKLASWIR